MHMHIHLCTYIQVMPPKKGQASQKASVESGQQAPPLLHEGMDPITAAIAVVDKKARNLEKRKVGRKTICCNEG